MLQKAKQVSVRKSRDLLRLDVVQGDVDDRHRDQGQHRLADGLKVEQRLGLAVDGQDVAGGLGRLLDKLGANEDEDVPNEAQDNSCADRVVLLRRRRGHRLRKRSETDVELNRVSSGQSDEANFSQNRAERRKQVEREAPEAGLDAQRVLDEEDGDELGRSDVDGHEGHVEDGEVLQKHLKQF